MKPTRAPRRVTLKDIAGRTGYTVNTVSRALKNMPDISQETCERIQAAANEMGYVRNWMASALRSGRSNTVAVIVGDLDNPKFAVMVNDIEAAARTYQYSVIILCTHEDEEIERRAIQTAIARQVDGIILNPCQVSDGCIAQLQASGIPFVLIERFFAGHDVDGVVCDEEAGGYLAGRHLLGAGHRRVVHLHGEERISGAILRRAGFLRATEALPREDVRCLPMARAGQANADMLLALADEGFTGAFIFRDMVALDILAHWPKDRPRIALIGFDNVQGTLSLPCSLCSIDPSSAEVCRATVDLLHSRILGEVSPPRRLVFPATLVCRQSCRA